MNIILRLLLGSIGGSLLTAGCWLGASTAYFPLTRIDLDEGRELFAQHCATCHNVDSQRQSSYGPDLSNIGVLAAQRTPNQSPQEYILASILTPDAYRAPGAQAAMPADIASDLDPTQVVSLVGYLMTCGATPNYNELTQLAQRVTSKPHETNSPIDFEQVDAGKQLYYGKGGCHQCHSLQALPGSTLKAPSLLTAGNHSQEFLRESICQPNRRLTPGYRHSQIVLESGQILAGRLVTDNEEYVELLVNTPTGLQLRKLKRDQIEVSETGKPSIYPQQQSTMPNDLNKSLTSTEINQLLAFLKTLR